MLWKKKVFPTKQIFRYQHFQLSLDWIFLACRCELDLSYLVYIDISVHMDWGSLHLEEETGQVKTSSSFCWVPDGSYLSSHQPWTPPCCTALHCTALHCTALPSTPPVLHCTVLSNRALQSTVLKYTVIYSSTVRCRAVQCSAVHRYALQSLIFPF